MPSSPSRPRIPAVTQPSPSPRPQAAALESVREAERQERSKRRGFSSTILTRGGLGQARTQKNVALGA